jgi:hypothetical protein
MNRSNLTNDDAWSRHDAWVEIARLRDENARLAGERDAARRAIRHAADALRAGSETGDAEHAAGTAAMVELSLSAIAKAWAAAGITDGPATGEGGGQ